MPCTSDNEVLSGCTEQMGIYCLTKYNSNIDIQCTFCDPKLCKGSNQIQSFTIITFIVQVHIIMHNNDKKTTH